MDRLSDEERDGLSVDNADGQMADGESHFIPSRIEQIFLHEIYDDDDQSMVRWVSDCLRLCDTECSIFKNIFFDDSNLNDDAVHFLCDALSLRSAPLSTLQSISFSWNRGVGSQCVRRLLAVLNEQCPGLESLDLSATAMDNASCSAMYVFWTSYLELRGEAPLGTLKVLDLRDNLRIDADGMDKIDSMFQAFYQLDEGQGLSFTVRVGGCGFSDINAMWDEHIDPYFEI